MRSRKPIQLKRKAVKKAVKNTKSLPKSSDASTAESPPSDVSPSKDGNDSNVKPGGNCRARLPRLELLPPRIIPDRCGSPIVTSSESLVILVSVINPGTST